MPQTGFERFILVALVPMAIAAVLWTWLEGRWPKGKHRTPAGARRPRRQRTEEPFDLSEHRRKAKIVCGG
jgi:hypothetical protein